jgi:hypothetical protein
MALNKIEVIDLAEVVENGSVQVRTKTVILENGVEISSNFHRHVIAPGDKYDGEDVRVQAICSATHTADVIASYKASIVKA